MSLVTPRLRMFAGPNGSGKSTLKTVLIPELLGAYLNPDEIEALIKQTGCLRPADFGVTTTAQDIIPFFAAARLLVDSGLQEVLGGARRRAQRSGPRGAVAAPGAGLPSHVLRPAEPPPHGVGGLGDR